MCNVLPVKIVIFSIMILVDVLLTDSYANTVSIITSQESEAHNRAISSFLQASARFERVYRYTLSNNANEIIKNIQKIQPDLVLAVGTKAALVAKNGLSNIPIVFCMVLNPFLSNLVDDMEHPGANITGVSLDIPLYTQFEYIKKVVTHVRRIGVIYNPKDTGTLVKEAALVAGRIGLILITEPISSEREVPEALKSLTGKIDVLWSVADQTVFGSQSAQYILLSTLRAGIPFVGLSESFVKAGALSALSCDYADIGRQTAEIARRVLRGEKNIPVTVPRKIMLYINLRTANQIDLKISEQVIRSANEVIN